ncbi:MAG: ATP-dependent helicase [Propionibacteriaceae bacterium]|jgi:DNA helicase-2/ATP-dependent DNA helicase PcrA|nr:ATP-dependent helicase [Propionibacteriaceae bacterium]
MTPEELKTALGIPFSEQQLAAICAPLEPQVVIAAAGSGKTTVMAARVVWLIGTGQVRPGEVLGLTFTRKATAELGERVRSALDKAELSGDDEPLVLTYDAFAKQLVDEHGFLIGAEADQRLMNTGVGYRLAIETVVGALREAAEMKPGTLANRLLELDAQMQSNLVSIEAVRKFCVSERAAFEAEKPTKAVEDAIAKLDERMQLLSLVEAFRKAKAERGLRSFSDVLQSAVKLSELEPVVLACREQYKIVLLDEYQDTSTAQARLLLALFGGGHPVTAVGDPLQAIYGWRGAAYSNIVDFSNQFRRADGSASANLPLNQNRRSDTAVLEAANVVAKPMRELVESKTGLELSLQAPEGTASGQITTEFFETDLEELDWLSWQIAWLKEAGKVSAWKDIAVLTRTNKEAAQVYAALGSQEIPAELVGLSGLLELPAVADVVAVLRLLDDPSDNPSCVRLLTSPRWAIGRQDLKRLGARARFLKGEVPGGDSPQDLIARLNAPAESLLEAVGDPGKGDPKLGDYSAAAKERLKAFAGEIRQLRRWRGGSLSDLASAVVRAQDAQNELSASGFDPAISGIAQFLQAVADFEEYDADASLSEFLAYLKAAEEGRELEAPIVSADDSVKVLSMHKAKGLEWDVVFIPGMGERNFPNPKVTDDWTHNAAELPAPLRGDADSIPQLRAHDRKGLLAFHEELKQEQLLAEDRLAYVALTRAKHLLYASGHAWKYGVKNPVAPSPYLEAVQTLAANPGTFYVPEGDNPLNLEEVLAPWPQLGDPELREQIAAAAELVKQGREIDWEHPELEGASAEELAECALDHSYCEGLLKVAQDDAAAKPQLPGYLSATAVRRATDKPEEYKQGALRPIPHLTSREQLIGTRFHEWLERYYNTPPTLDGLEPPVGGEVLEGRLSQLAEAFKSSRFAGLVPVAVEEPFDLKLGGVPIRGRIDAVFPGRGGFAYMVVDWKTGDARGADPLQLAIYRRAWAELKGVAEDDVEAVFYDFKGPEPKSVTLPNLDEFASRLAALA